MIETRSATLRARAHAISEQLAMDAFAVTDMSRATSLELDPTLSLGPSQPDARQETLRRLEGPIAARTVIRDDAPGPIRYFLDGSQKTLPVWRVGAMPVVASVTAAGILQRLAPDDISLVPETLAARMHWILPRYTDNAALNRIVALLEGSDEHVVDPLDAIHRDDPDLYRQMIGGYTHVLEQAYAAASNLRAQTELDLLQFWQQEVRPHDRDGRIVVDGRLQTDTPNAIGVVKQAQAQHLEGQEAIALYDLKAGQRTGAYILIDENNREQAGRTMWYLRMQNATGLDARHGLIRLETPAILTEPELVDRISSWILAERAPRASSDARWATLLYPIHLLERMLKRRIQHFTVGWPA